MLKYLVVLLEERAVSFCHYDSGSARPDAPSAPMPLATLKATAEYARSRDLAINFVYGSRPLPVRHAAAIEKTDHIKMVPFPLRNSFDAAVVVAGPEDLDSIGELESNRDRLLILRLNKASLPDLARIVEAIWGRFRRLNLCLLDIEKCTDDDIDLYRSQLLQVSETLLQRSSHDPNVEINCLTDRLMLTEMRNCDAGIQHVTVAPNGRLYICPAFYYRDARDSTSDLTGEPVVPNGQLLQIDHAPICSRCDAYQCRRCVFLNQTLTNELNTPSWQQCRLSHAEREASRQLAARLASLGISGNIPPIPELDYNDPFELVTRRQEEPPPQPRPDDDVADLTDRQLLERIYHIQMEILSRLR